MIRLGLIACFVAILGCVAAPPAGRGVAFSPRSTDTTQPVASRPIDRAIIEGTDFLIRSQNPDGSWGTGLQTRGTEIYHTVPGSHDAYRGGTTALCVMALREASRAGVGRQGLTEAHAKGLEFLINDRQPRREDGAILYNIWAHIYGLQALAQELQDRDDPRMRAAASWHVRQLERFAAYNGGWNYYDFDAQTQKPSMEATSFGTAAGLIALWDARQVGITVPEDLVRRSLLRLEECRTPGGWFLYGADSRYMLTQNANREMGAIGRTQSCNDALVLWGSGLVDESRAAGGLRRFLDNHQWIAMGRKRPFPHEAWYQTSGYYYYFGHFYASRLIERLETPDRAELARRLSDCVLPFQESDGSWWDYAMWDYHKPYGTAYAVMTLLRCRATIEREHSR